MASIADGVLIRSLQSNAIDLVDTGSRHALVSASGSEAEDECGSLNETSDGHDATHQAGLTRQVSHVMLPKL